MVSQDLSWAFGNAEIYNHEIVSNDRRIRVITNSPPFTKLDEIPPSLHCVSKGVS